MNVSARMSKYERTEVAGTPVSRDTFAKLSCWPLETAATFRKRAKCVKFWTSASPRISSDRYVFT